MPTILVLGAGRSAACLIDYLGQWAAAHAAQLVVADADPQQAARAIRDFPTANSMILDVADEVATRQAVAAADVVVSLLPPHLHLRVARHCLAEGRHLLTASYVTPDMEALDADARRAGLVFLNECGLDPGLDHLSAMHLLDGLRREGATIMAFRSYCGGLVAPASDDNPWQYKFTWNPRNVVLAGSGGAVRFRRDGADRFIPYHQLFARTETVSVAGYGDFEAYANRDSLRYAVPYGLADVPTLLRGTLRRPGFGAAWHLLVQLGLTDDSYHLAPWPGRTYADLLRAFLPPGRGPLRAQLATWAGLSPDAPAIERIAWLGLCDELLVPLEAPTPAQALQARLETCWALGTDDRDMIVMQHAVAYAQNGQAYQRTSNLVVEGTTARTAMAQTVGWPLGMATRLVLEGKVTTPGVQIPTAATWYKPILAELRERGVDFVEETAQTPVQEKSAR